MIGLAWWDVHEHPPQTPQEINAAFQRMNDLRISGSPVAGMNKPLAQAFSRAAFFSEQEIMQGRPYVTLSLLAVHPEHQRRGVGSLLLRHGLEKFDPLGLPTYLDCGRYGKALYERYGFEVVKDFPFDGREHGGRSEGKHWCMLRPAQTSS